MNRFGEQDWPMPGQVDPDGPGYETHEEIGHQLDYQFAKALEQRQRQFDRRYRQRGIVGVMESVALFCIAVAGVAVLGLLVIVIGWCAYHYLPGEARSVYHFFNQN